MGQYLAIGLVTRANIQKIEINQAKLTIDALQERMHKEFFHVPEIYDLDEDDRLYRLEINKDILNNQLVPFLKAIYPLLYDDKARYDNVMKKLSIMPASEWLDWAETRPAEVFQFDENADNDYIKEGFSNVNIYYDCLTLSMEGKILMEAYGRQFKFIKHTMLQTFKEFSLAGALRIYITG